MSRRRVLKKPLTVSLFPFLAVLICTFGVLIVLLVLTTKSVEIQAATDARELHNRTQQQANQLKRLENQLEETETLLDIVSNNRPDAVAELNKAREYRGHLEADIQRLKKEINSLDAALAAQAKPLPGSVSLEEKAGRVKHLTEQLLAAEKELAKRRKDFQANARVTYSIVPHEGNGGTLRRPIFLESRGTGIVIQPLGIELKKEDFVPPLGPGNPLDAAVLAIREYWQTHQGDELAGSPYPLIVIRPDGAEGYAICRRALTSWEDEFGYELVESEKELNFGTPDLALKDAVQAAIDEAKLRQQKMLAARPVARPETVQQIKFGGGRGSSGREIDSRPGLIVSGSGGGFVVNSGWEELYQQSESIGGSPVGSTSGTSELSEADSNGNNLTFTSPRGSHSGIKPGVGGKSPSFSSSSAERSNASTQLALPTGGSSGSPPIAQHNQADDGWVGPEGAGGEYSETGSHGTRSATAGATGRNSSGMGKSSLDQPCENGNCQPAQMYQHLNIAKSRGRDWAVPNKTQGATAYVRPIRIVCTENELEVMSPLGVANRISVDRGIEAAIDPLVNEIWRQIETWGMPGERSYWKPELRISVVEGGENNFDKLQGLLFNSGVQVRESGQ